MHRHWLITYDVADNARRRSLEQLLQSHGERVQASKFECWLTPAAMRQLWTELSAMLDAQEDCVHAFALCVTCHRASKKLGVDNTSGSAAASTWIV